VDLPDYEENWDDDSDDIKKEKPAPKKQEPLAPVKREVDKKRSANDVWGIDDDDDAFKKHDDLLDEIPTICMANNDAPGQKDAFNKIVGNKEKGGLLASTGISKEEARAYAQKGLDVYDSVGSAEDNLPAFKKKVKMAEVGAAGKRKDTDEELLNRTRSSGMSEVEVSEEQRATIEEQFKMLYEKDPDLRKALSKSDINSISIGDKFQIIEAYLSEGGVGGLQIQVEDDE